MPAKETDLGSAELEVLKTLWEIGPATVRDVMNQLHEHGRKLAYTTVLTFLTRLEQKGCVTSDKSGVAYIYRAAVTREKVSEPRLKAIVQQIYDGAIGPVILQLMRSDEHISPEDIAQLEKLIDQLDRRSRRD